MASGGWRLSSDQCGVLVMRMTLRPEELLRQLRPLTTIYPELCLAEDGCTMSIHHGTVEIDWRAVSPIRLGIMELPVTEVSLAFSKDFPTANMDKFVADMRRVCARGGG